MLKVFWRLHATPRVIALVLVIGFTALIIYTQLP